jgi:sec-independent protein translocase protein TatA
MTPSVPPLAILDFIGGSELLLILFIVLILFGGEKLPELARGFGKTLREIKKATAGVEDEIKKALAEPPPPAKKPSPEQAAKPAAEPYEDPYHPKPPAQG